MQEYVWETADEIDLALAGRLRNVRRRRRISQQRLSGMSGVSWGSIKRFERTGEISLRSLTRLAMALGCAEELRGLFAGVPYRTIEEVIHDEG